MSYTHGYDEVVIKAADNLTTTAGVRAEYSPKYQPVLVRAVGLLFTTAPGNDNLVTEFNHRPNYGSSSNEVQVAQIAATAAQGAAGKIRYTQLDPPIKLKPGESLSFEVTTATSSTGVADAFAVVEPCW